MASLDLDLDTVVDNPSGSFGSRYVNDSFEGTGVRRVVSQPA